jgi:hypothetical protein
VRLGHEHAPRWIPDLKGQAVGRFGMAGETAGQVGRSVTGGDGPAHKVLGGHGGRQYKEDQNDDGRKSRGAQRSVHDTRPPESETGSEKIQGVYHGGAKQNRGCRRAAEGKLSTFCRRSVN